MTFHHVETEEEARAVSRLAREVFGPGSGFIVPAKPKWAIFARTEEGEIAGGVILKRLGGGVGIIDFIFVHKRGRGEGLGPRLLERGAAALDEAGCTTQFALVRDDNTPSWNMFAKRGYTVPNFFRVLFGYSAGAGGYALLLLLAMTGYSMWVREPKSTADGPESGPSGKRLRVRGGLFISLFFTVIVAAAIGRFGAAGTEWLLWATGFFTAVSVVRMLLTYPIARAYGPVRFRLSHGGALMTVLSAGIGNWWPHFGFWTPKEPIWHFSSFGKHEGRAALVGWLVTIAAMFGTLLIPIAPIAAALRRIMIAALVFQAIPFPPFEGMDGYRVMQWSPIAWVIGLGATVTAILLT